MTPNKEERHLSRREFIRGSSALVIGVGLSGCAPGESRLSMLSGDDETAAAVGSSTGADVGPRLEPDAFVRVNSDNTVTLVMKHVEFGQGPYTGLSTLIAEELDADWAQVRVVAAPANDEKYKNLLMGRQGTGGSTAIANSFYQMRKAGAAAKQMLVEGAAETWSVPAAEIEVTQGEIKHPPSGRSGRFADFIEAASQRPVPVDPTLKKPEDFVLIGKEGPRIDSYDKSHGKAKYTIDAYRENMLTAVVAHPSVFGAKVARFDATMARKVRGVVDVQQIPQGVAVYGSDTFAAIQGRRALDVEWDLSEAETRSSEEMLDLCREASKTTGLVATSKGDPATRINEGASEEGTVRVDAEYAFPLLAHASMEPLDALIENQPAAEGPGSGGVLVTMGNQSPTRDQKAIAEELGLELDQVEMDVQLSGGSFGRRSTIDAHFATEAAEVFKAQSKDATARRPVKLIYTREDDIQGGYYRPLIVHRVSAAMTREGKIKGWEHAVAGQSFFSGPYRAMLKGKADHTMVEGASDLAYATDDLLVSNHFIDTGVPVLWWRSVGHTHTAFAVEAMIDELLEQSGIDAVDGRLALLADQPRHRGVLKRAAEMAGWGRKPEPGKAFGVAVHKSFRSYVAQIVEVEAVQDPHRPKVTRVWCAVDCGIAVNPSIVRAQMEGGIGFGLGAALFSELHIDAGGQVREQNFDRYQNLRTNDMPEVEVSIIESKEDPTGVGEPGVPPIAPAVANAWRRLTGQRTSRLPFVHKA